MQLTSALVDTNLASLVDGAPGFTSTLVVAGMLW